MTRPTEQSCANCRQFGITPPEGKMPGVRENYRTCSRPRLNKSLTEWRSPTDWCIDWTQLEKAQ